LFAASGCGGIAFGPHPILFAVSGGVLRAGRAIRRRAGLFVDFAVTAIYRAGDVSSHTRRPWCFAIEWGVLAFCDRVTFFCDRVAISREPFRIAALSPVAWLARLIVTSGGELVRRRGALLFPVFFKPHRLDDEIQ
jgi:hypothetical protein